MHAIKPAFYTALLATLITALNGCMVGPNFKPPAPPPTQNTYIQNQTVTKTTSDPAAKNAGKAQYFQIGRDIPAEWWRLFHSRGIDALMQAGFKYNPTVQAAKAAVVEAEENLKAQIGTLFPTITASFLAQRQRFSDSIFGANNPTDTVFRSHTFNFYNPALNGTMTLDVFGGLRRQIEATGAQLNFQQFELEAAYLNLASSIATTAISIAALKAEIEATNMVIKAQTNTLRIVNGQFNIGAASKADVLLQETELASTIAILPPLQQNLAQQYHALSTLIGTLPREDQFPPLHLRDLHLPKDLPLSCPTLLVRQRPDVRAAEALLHAASAQIGVATANLFPQVVINGGYGWQGNVLNSLFSPGNVVWNIASTATQTLFQGGTLIARRRAAIAAYEQARAQYKQTVLQAFQDVADTLRALQNDAELLKARRRVETTSLKNLNLIQEQFALGGVSFLDLLIAQRNYQQSLIGRIQAQSSRYMDTARLFQVLGGGWWNPPIERVTVIEETIRIAEVSP